MESCDALARAASVTLKRSGRARSACVRGDQDKLAQVFINLISNAIKYNASTAPVVVVTSIQRTGLYEMRVADNGPGIPESERERIFEKFVRGREPRQAGAGLGLAISRQIVERFEGSLLVATSRLGGVEFIVRLATTANATKGRPTP
jgi:signal transduction histidine kinase